MEASEKSELAKQIIKEILYDLTGRGGLDGAWYSIDTDIQEEIVDSWESIVVAKLP